MVIHKKGHSNGLLHKIVIYHQQPLLRISALPVIHTTYYSLFIFIPVSAAFLNTYISRYYKPFVNQLFIFTAQETYYLLNSWVTFQNLLYYGKVENFL